MARWTPLDPTSLDLTNFDLAHLDLSSVDLADLVRSTIDATGQATNAVSHRAIELAKDAAYVTVGLGLLSYQRMQVRRRELERSLRR
jgi:hypothetical protein